MRAAQVVPAASALSAYLDERRRSERTVGDVAAARAIAIARAAHVVTRAEALAAVDLAETIAAREATGVRARSDAG